MCCISGTRRSSAIRLSIGPPIRRQIAAAAAAGRKNSIRNGVLKSVVGDHASSFPSPHPHRVSHLAHHRASLAPSSAPSSLANRRLTRVANIRLKPGQSVDEEASRPASPQNLDPLQARAAQPQQDSWKQLLLDLAWCCCCSLCICCSWCPFMPLGGANMVHPSGSAADGSLTGTHRRGGNTEVSNLIENHRLARLVTLVAIVTIFCLVLTYIIKSALETPHEATNSTADALLSVSGGS